MRVTRWQDRVRKRSPEARERVDAAVRASVDGVKAEGQSTGEQCARCGLPLRTGDDATTDGVGRGMHARCAPPAKRKKAPKKKRAASKKRWGPVAQREKPAKRIEGERLKPISLHPLEFEEALRRLLGSHAKR